MTQQFEQISSQGFMKHNGGILFRKILDNEYEFKSKITQNNLNHKFLYQYSFLFLKLSQVLDHFLNQIDLPEN